jgi:hypothetical protein
MKRRLIFWSLPIAYRLSRISRFFVFCQKVQALIEILFFAKKIIDNYMKVLVIFLSANFSKSNPGFWGQAGHLRTKQATQ